MKIMVEAEGLFKDAERLKKLLNAKSGEEIVKLLAEYDNSRRIGDESDRARGQGPSV